MASLPGGRQIALQTLLGFDFGLQRVGIAVGQIISGTASALCTLTARNGKPDWESITGLIENWRPDALVVGLPLHADGSDSSMTTAARAFVQQLEERYHLPVYTMDERLSSHAAAALVRTEKAAKKKGIDAIAAGIILENWLAARNNNG
ncbi:MAG: Holliday junction resolvase RuvX, partial [Gammaproteobacteria bacterium]